MIKPIIGVLGARMINGGGPAPVPADYVNRAYCAAVEKGGGIPVVLPVPVRIEDGLESLALCQGLLVPGGLDVDPRFYGEDPLPVLGTLDADMDRFWIAAVKFAKEKGLPVLGICRGLQLVNVALGGSLYQDISQKNKEHFLHTQRQNRDYLMHEVVIRGDSRLASLLGAETIFTNTMHHQCVKEPGQGLAVTAWTRDQIPEAMESADGQFILVQWHPEELLESEPRMLALFSDLAERSVRTRSVI